MRPDYPAFGRPGFRKDDFCVAVSGARRTGPCAGERMSTPTSADPVVRLLLYVADHTENSVAAVHNLTAICATHLPGRYEIEVVDVFTQPDRAREDHILMTPTLIVPAPPPARRVVGTLRQPEKVLLALGLGPDPA